VTNAPKTTQTFASPNELDEGVVAAIAAIARMQRNMLRLVETMQALQDTLAELRGAWQPLDGGDRHP
jgi:uncharacterized coiled-coil protein SlyX